MKKIYAFRIGDFTLWLNGHETLEIDGSTGVLSVTYGNVHITTNTNLPIKAVTLD